MKYLIYALKRLVSLVPVLFGISLIVFFLIRRIPGDPAASLLGSHVTPEAILEIRTRLGLEEPVWRQYLTFMGHLLQGDLGHSYVYDSSVTSLIATSLPTTLWLLVPVLGLGMPAFWLGIMLILVFGLKLGWFPVAGYGETVPEHVRGMVLPGLTIALTLSPILIRSLRASMIDVLGSDYIVTARSKGLSSSEVMRRHVLRNAAISSVTVLGINIAYLTGSTLVVERVFSLPGIGQQMLNSILGRDFPTVQGITLVFAVMVVTVNLLTDVTHAVLDPRVRLT